MTFNIVHGTQETKPQEIEYCGENVFVRKNIKRVVVEQENSDDVEMWEYEEAYLTRIEFLEMIINSLISEDEFHEIISGE